MYIEEECISRSMTAPLKYNDYENTNNIRCKHNKVNQLFYALRKLVLNW